MYIESLKYPFNLNIIQKRKRSIKKELLQGGEFVEKKIAIMGGSTTSEIKDILEIFLLKEGIKAIFYESGFNRYYEEILFENNTLKAFCPDIIYIHTTRVNIQHLPVLSDTVDEVRAKLDDELGLFISIWKKIRKEYKCIVIQNNFELPEHRMLGNLDFSDLHGEINFIMNLNLGFAEYAKNHQEFYINDINYLSAWFGLEKWHDKIFWYSFKYALSYDAIPFLAHNVATIVKAIYGRSKKCLVLDLDNTLWGGVIGDDGLDNINIGKDTAVGEAYTAFQCYIKGLKERGIILAVCSKNDMSNALEGFLHPDSILKVGDFSSFKANWDSKEYNIEEIAKDIDIGTDSLVFIDDNPVEREIVRAQVPAVEVPEIGKDIIRFIEFIDKEGYFEPASLSSDDLKRGGYYQENAHRARLQTTYADYGAFLQSLEMRAEINTFKHIYLERITQLINKTNQFNLTTKRYDAAKVMEIYGDQQYLTLYGRLSDKFGDSGLASVIVGLVNDDVLHIDIWLMSCRVIKRDMELAMFDALVAGCKVRGVKKIMGYYSRTPKNNIVSNHFRDLGFVMLSKEENADSKWEYVVPTNYELKNISIEVIK